MAGPREKATKAVQKKNGMPSRITHIRSLSYQPRRSPGGDRWMPQSVRPPMRASHTSPARAAVRGRSRLMMPVVTLRTRPAKSVTTKEVSAHSVCSEPPPRITFRARTTAPATATASRIQRISSGSSPVAK
jgi:hypothetical protein